MIIAKSGFQNTKMNAPFSRQNLITDILIKKKKKKKAIKRNSIVS